MSGWHEINRKMDGDPLSWWIPCETKKSWLRRMIRTKRKDCSCGKIDDLHSIHTGEKQQRKVNKRGSQRIVRDANAHFNPTVLGTRVHCEDWMTVWLGTRASGADIHSGSGGGGMKVIRRDTQRMESKTMLTKALWFLIPVVSETHLSMQCTFSSSED